MREDRLYADPQLAAARAAGHPGRLCGLDPAEGMLARARAHANIEWVCGEAAALAPKREFDLALMTGHAFQVLIEDAELRAALAAVHAALRSEGRFVFESRNPAAHAWEQWTPEHAVEVTDEEGHAVRVTLRVEAPFDGRTLSYSETYSSAGWNAPQVSRSVLRFLDAQRLARFLAAAGFAIEAQFGGLDRRPLAHDSPEIVTVARARRALTAARE
jgi:ubiquinone/menaquinone biosynthesis C-methylase UbiE